MSFRMGGGPHAVYRSYVAVGIGATTLMLVAVPLIAYLGPMRVDWSILWPLDGATALGTVVIGLLPWSQLMRGPNGQWALYAWSLFELGVAGAVVAATGGQRSWFWVLFVLTTVFFAAGYPPFGQMGLLVVTVTAYLGALAAAGTSVFAPLTLWRVAILLATFVLSSFPSAELRRQTAEQVAARREADELADRLEQRETWWRSLIEHTSDPIVVFGEGGQVTFASPAFETLLGIAPVDVEGAQIDWLVHPDDLEPVQTAARAAVGGPSTQAVCRLRHRDAGWRHTEVSFAEIGRSSEGRVVANVHDVTKRVEAEAALSHQATHDPLTGLANSRAFYGALESNVALARRRGEPLTVLLIDLDRFKAANDTFGHAFGDQVLIAVARRMEATLREADVIARLGGDEFTAVLATGGGPGGSALAAQRLWEALRQPLSIGDQTLELAVSIGVAWWPDHGSDPDALMRAADHAMYRAKRSGGGVASERRSAIDPVP